jgi:hypothetical protein
MVTKTDWTPVVLLIVMCLAGACVFGALLQGGELFNPTAPKQQAEAAQTAAQMVAPVTQVAVQATVAVQVATLDHQSRVMQMTEMPVVRAQEAVNQRATQDVLDFQARVAARQREQEQGQFNDRVNAAAQYGAFASVLLAMVLLTFLFIQVGRWIRAEAHYREREAEARILSEQRQAAEMKIVVARRTAHRPTNGNGQGNKGANGQQTKTPEYSKQG